MNLPLQRCLLIVLIACLVPIGVLHVEPATPQWPMFWQLRATLVNYTGVTSMLLMSMCIILSVKHWPLERWLGGLDQQYRLHKYLGICAVFTALTHWLIYLSDDLMMTLQLVDPREQTYPFWKLIDAFAEHAQLIGEYGFYLSAGLVLIAWSKRFTYRVFQLTHSLFPYLYLLLLIHMLMFFEQSLWLSLSGGLLFITCTLAVIGAILTLLDANGKPKRFAANLTQITPTAYGVEIKLSVDQQLENGFCYRPGQFALVRFHSREKPHPFSLASDHSHDNCVRLMIKANGEYTQSLAAKLKLRQSAQIEGPYGGFNFADHKPQHIWLAAGIGIAPFLSAIETVGREKSVDLFYCYRHADPELLSELRHRAKQSGIRLHLNNTAVLGHLDCNEVISCINDVTKCSVWYCGPIPLGNKLKRAMLRAKLPKHAFHKELFDFR
ncbi:ferredoxin reductase family protein [Vibrio sp. WXL103]|uniref:ferredoxin reductase family protein n=1 Tax=Vibrio sp. WXL103 TaxID=3450710 RepID=UPI003EC58942